MHRSAKLMLTLTLFLAAFASGAASAVGAAGSSAPSRTRYRVTIKNLTGGQPFSPPVAATHRPGIHMFRMGYTASDALAAIAQDGMPEPMYNMLKGANGVTGAVNVGHPVAVRRARLNVMGMVATDTATFEIMAAPGDKFSLASMLICTNDGFFGLDSVALPGTGARTFMLSGYDAGREQNTERSIDLVDHCTEFGVATLRGDPNFNADAAVATTPLRPIAPHAGIKGAGSLTVRTHGWSNPVARVTIARVDARQRQVTPSTLPDTGAETSAPFYLLPAVAAMMALGLTLRARSRRSA